MAGNRPQELVFTTPSFVQAHRKEPERPRETGSTTGRAGRVGAHVALEVVNAAATHDPATSPTGGTAAGSAGRRPPGPDHVHDVLVVGGGPAGSSCAYWLAEAGWDVAVVEKKVFPRDKTCGDGLTPRSVRQIADMGIEGSLAGAHRYTGLRAHAFGRRPRPSLARPPDLSSLRLRVDPPRPRRHRHRAGGQGRGHRLAGHRGRGAHRRRAGRRTPSDRGPPFRPASERW